MWLTLPPSNAIKLRGSAAHLRFDLLAELALRSRRDGVHNKLHTTRFADSVLLDTVLSEVAPLPIATGKTMLVVKAHVSGLRARVFTVWLYISLAVHLCGWQLP